MNLDNLEETCNRLVDQLGGYNLRSFVIIAVGGVASGYLLGGLATRLLGPFYLLLPLLVCLAAFGVVKARKYSARERAIPPTDRTVQPDQVLPQERRPAPPVRSQPSPRTSDLSDLERYIVEQATQGDGNLSVGAIAEELDVTSEDVRKAAGELARRGLIALG